MAASEKAREAYLKAVREIRDSVPKILINVGIAVLIWALTRYAFIPISRDYLLFNIPLPQLIGLVMLIAVAILVLGVIREILDITDAAAAYAAYTIGAVRGEVAEEELENYRTGFRGIVYVIIVVLVFILFRDFLNILHPLLSAVLLIVVVIWAVLTLMRSGRAFSGLVSYYTEEWAKRLESRLQTE